MFEAARIARLTRNQHVLFRLGELAALTEGSAALARRAARAAAGALPEKTGNRFGPETLAAMARVFAREAATKVAEEGTRWVVGAADPGAARDLAAGLPLDAVRAAQTGLIADMDAVADVLYARVTT